MSGSNGEYTLDGIAPGEVTIEVSGGKYVPQQRALTVRAGQQAPEDFRLSPLSASIDVVESLREYHLEETSLATRTLTRLIDVPQSVQVYPNQLIEDRAILEGNELFRNVSGINQSTYSAMVFRGFTQREILYNGARGNPFGSLEGDVNNAGFSTSQIRLTNIQRVEVLKGPTSALYGAGEPGGLINYVTKQPKEVIDGELQVRLGSFNQKYANGDFGGPIGKRLFARGAFYMEDRDTFRTNSGSTNSHAVANLLYKLNDRHRLSAEGEFLNQTLGGQRLRGVPVNAVGTFLTNIQWSANEPSDKIKMIGRVLQLRGDHNFRNGWDASFTFRYLEFENNDKYHEPRGLNAATATGQTMRREFRNYFRSNDDWSIVGNASRSVKTGSLSHRLVIGFERFDQDHLFRSARTREVEVGGGQVLSLDLFRPVYGATDPSTYRLSPFVTSTANTSRTGFYGQDQIAINRYVQALVSGRVDRYKDKGFSGVPLSYEGTTLSGRAGLVVKPVEPVSFYGSVANSVTRAPLFSQAPSANGPFKPETGRQGEVGVKSEWFNRRVFLTGAFFHLNKSNILRPDPALGPQGNNANALLAVGQARSRGVEFNVEGFLTSRLYTTFNYAFVSTRILKDNVAAVVGKPLANAPQHTAGLFARYNFLKRTGIGFGLESLSERVEPFAGIRADGYAIADVAIYQEFNAWSRLQFQVTNVANSTYSASSLFAARAGNIPGQPRALIVTLTVNPFRR
jgi:iron complex outermembrane recepter protein